MEDGQAKALGGAAESKRLSLCEMLSKLTESGGDIMLKEELLCALSRVRVNALNSLPSWKLASEPGTGTWIVLVIPLNLFLHCFNY